MTKKLAADASPRLAAPRHTERSERYLFNLTRGKLVHAIITAKAGWSLYRNCESAKSAVRAPSPPLLSLLLYARERGHQPLVLGGRELPE